MCEHNHACGGHHDVAAAASPAGIVTASGGNALVVGSYSAEDCVFLLSRMPGSSKEDMLSWEEAPPANYVALYEQAMRVNGARLARDVVALAAGIACKSEGKPVVLASLARAGTPFGVLLVRALRKMGIDAMHYGVSLIRGVGIDTGALDHIQRNHRGAGIFFIDGWTGKGGISKHLSKSVTRYSQRLRGKLLCISDLAGVSLMAATTDDYLIPSAIIDAPMNGLVSKTFFQPNGDIVISSPQFHEAYVYDHLKDCDLSNDFVDRISAHFDAALAESASAPLPLAGRAQFGVAMTRCIREQKRLAAMFGVDDGDRIKHGYNETLRAIQRRQMQLLLIRDDADPQNDGLIALADKLDIAVLVDPDLKFGCVGICGERLSQ
jgi:hypothetical protein